MQSGTENSKDKKKVIPIEMTRLANFASVSK